MRTHEAKLKAMASELREHRATQLAKKARGKEAEEQRQKEAYLEFEVSSQPRHLLLPQGLCVPCTELMLSRRIHFTLQLHCPPFLLDGGFLL